MTVSKPPPYLLPTLLSLIGLSATLIAAHYSKGTAVVTLPKETAIQAGGIAMTLILGLSVWVVSLIYSEVKAKKDYRRAQILRWRDAIHSNFEQLEFCDTVVFSEVRPHLSRATLDSIEGNKLTVRIGRGGNLIKSLVLDDIANLEKQWGII